MWTGSPFSCCAGRGLYSASAHALLAGHHGDPDLLANGVADLPLGIDDEQDEMLALAEPFLDRQDDLPPRQLARRQVGSARLDLLGRVHLVTLGVLLVAAEYLDRESLLRSIAAEVPHPELHRPGLVRLDHAGLDAPRGQGELGVGCSLP